MTLKKKKVIYETRKPLKLPWLRIIQVIVLGTLFSLLPEQNVYSFKTFDTRVLSAASEIIAPPPAPLPVKRFDVPPPQVSAEGITIIDIPSGMLLFEKNPDLRLFPASTTKIMTALVSLDQYKFDDIVTVKNIIIEGQRMHLIAGETITVENLLYGILVHSANDAAFALAEHHPGGMTQFVALMNQKAAELHLESTHFTNPAGFDDPNHYTTARDLTRLSRVALENHEITKIVAIPQITVSDSSFRYFHPLKNVNELLGKVLGVSGFKTGYSEGAGQSVVTTVNRDGHKVLIVVLKSQDRFGETEQLLNWLFQTFEWKEITQSMAEPLLEQTL